MDMDAKRKKQLKQREEKRTRQENYKHLMLNRVTRFIGVHELFDQLPDRAYNLFIDRIAPGVEVVVDEGSKDHLSIRNARRLITALVKRPLSSSLDGRDFYLSMDDIHRCYFSVVSGINFLARAFQGDHGPEL